MARAEEFPAILAKMTGRGPLRNVPLREYSNFRIGGPADYFFEAASREELRAALRASRECGLAAYVIGGGFNLLFDDDGFRGLILRNASTGLAIDPSGPRIRAESGTPLGDLVRSAAEAGLEGIEFLAGIPGSVGGAVYGNAGAFGSCTGDALAEVRLLGPGDDERRVPGKDLGFSYRHSRLKSDRRIVLEAVFELRPGLRESLRSKINGYLALRADKHPPLDMAYAGSYFKNPALPDGMRKPAGQLLEQVGAKDARVGGAAVYSGHANFLYNTGNATARDVLALAALLKKRVWDAFGIDLEEEVIALPAVFSAL
jgi:UDP-N-acetylmuramate dehydrogenase